MADETWAAKVSPELKEEIGQMVKESGLSSKEFLEVLISKHKIQLLQGNDSERHEDIQQVTYHLDKIKASFVGLVEKGIDLKQKFNESLEQESTLHKAITDQQQSQIALAHAERDKAIFDKSELESRMAEIEARNEELESGNKTHRITIQMQQEKLSQLELRIESVAELEEEVSRLSQEKQIQEKRLESLVQESENHIRGLRQAEEAKEAQGKEAEKAIEQIKQVHRLELDRASLEIEKKMLGENQKIREEYFLKIEALTSKNQELTGRLHEIELERKESVTPKNKGKTKPGVPSSRVESDEND